MIHAAASQLPILLLAHKSKTALWEFQAKTLPKDYRMRWLATVLPT
jgi:hypothetical protein